MNETSQPNHPASLPESWIERIFSHMACLYGNKLADMWGGQDATTIKAFWAIKLRGFASRPEVIAAALESLEGRQFPPTLPEFIGLCRDALRRTPAGPALPPPAIDKAMARKRLQELKRHFHTQKGNGAAPGP